MKTVTAAIIIRDEHVLLTRRGPGEKLAGFWEFPGGKLDEDETIQQCLERELCEELNVKSIAGDVFAESIYHYDHGSFRLIGIHTKLLTEGISLTVHDKAEWVGIADLLNYKLASADIPLAQELIRELHNEKT